MKSLRKTEARMITSCDGEDLRGMFKAAGRSIERNVQFLNSLNVFPVPDGDTGTNMLLTMRAAIEEATRSHERSAAAVARALSRGALMGARGNSGVILSQIFRGLAEGLDAKKTFKGSDLAAAFAESSNTAYKGVSKPVEGTMLTVIREAAAAARARACSNGSDVLSVMEALVDEARASVSRTPELLPVLRQAGVVDAGGEGLSIMFEGALRYLKGDEEGAVSGKASSPMRSETVQELAGETPYGYCTEFLLEGTDLDTDAIRSKLSSMGESVMVVGDDTTVRVHLHTFDPGVALSYGSSLGTLRQTKVDNMQDQHRYFLAALGGLPSTAISTVAVASGEGIEKAFTSIGATRVVSGGETMNPSVRELLEAVESVPSDNVIILPNNPNILLPAGQVQALTSKKVEIVPSVSIPQGIAALLAFDFEAGLEKNLENMKAALASVHSGEVTTAVRSMNMDHIKVKKGQSVAFMDGELVAASNSVPEVIFDLLSRIGVSEGNLVTLYYGANTSAESAGEIAESIRKKYQGLDVEVVPGGQPHYNYIVSAE